MIKETFQYGTYQDVNLSISYYPAKLSAASRRPAIIYFHGGGLIFGQRDDLPKPYIDLITQQGYPLVTVDYPLAPEAKLSDIFQALADFFTWFDLHYADCLRLDDNRKILFGRSAGAYLALLWATRLPVEAVISFYGYYTFFHNQFTNPSVHFNNYPSIPAEQAKRLIQSKALVATKIEERYPLYMYYRQSGTWLDALLADGETLDTYSLKVPELKQLPPTFLAASRADEDVPFFLSQLMSKWIPDNHFIPLEALPHDFDRDPSLPSSMETYQSLLVWLEQVVGH